MGGTRAHCGEPVFAICHRRSALGGEDVILLSSPRIVVTDPIQSGLISVLFVSAK
jgi:hypothetical protein